jgi:hypothetical protein
MWILASRGRPENIMAFIKAWIDTKAKSKVYLRLDTCDEMLTKYTTLDYPKEFNVVVGPRARLVAASNEMFSLHPNEDWYGLLADDLRPKTEYWDQILISEAGRKYVAGANDLTPKPLNLCHPVVGGDLVRKVGWFGFPYTTHFCIELPWKHLTMANKAFLKYVPDVVVEHAHYRYGKTTFDSTYKQSQSIKSLDKEIWKQWRATKFDEFYNQMVEVQ